MPAPVNTQDGPLTRQRHASLPSTLQKQIHLKTVKPAKPQQKPRQETNTVSA